MSVEARRMDRLADLMADGCVSLTEAAYRMRAPLTLVTGLWAKIRRGLGPQAR